MSFKKNTKVLPAFGGIVSKKVVPQIQNSEIQKVFSNSNLSLFTLNTSKEDNFYAQSENSFVWYGGQKKRVDTDLAEILNSDDKFILIKFDSESLKIFTDHYSKIPLFYIANEAALIFSSSLELLFLLNHSQKFEVNFQGILFYYNFGFVDYENFLFNDVKSVPGGQELEYDYPTNALKRNTYYNIFDLNAYNKAGASFEDNVSTIDKVLLTATTKTLDHHNSIGIALSGGVDSGYLAQKIHECGKQFKAYSLGFDNDYNEFDRIDYLAKKLDFPVEKIIVGPQDIIDNYLEVSENSSFPVGFNNSILNFIYKSASSDGIEIMFDGDGADRLFLGMNKYLQLQKILWLYKRSRNFGVHKLMPRILPALSGSAGKKLGFYFQKFNEGIPFYGERKLSNNQTFVKDYEFKINDLALPNPLKQISGSVNNWLFFSLFSVYYTPSFFFHTPYELQLQHKLVSNPQFWSDDMVQLALSIPLDQKLYKKTTKLVLREAAKLKIDDGYWNLSKIGLQNSYQYMKQSNEGKDFVISWMSKVKTSDEYKFLVETVPEKSIDAERLIPYYIWKQKFSNK